jgi:hypothetical protein
MKLVLLLGILAVISAGSACAYDTLLDSCINSTPVGMPDDNICKSLLPPPPEANKTEIRNIVLNSFTQGDDVYTKHKFVDYWNRNLNFTAQPPEGITPFRVSCGFSATKNPQNINCINDSWSKLFTVMDSFEENNTVYIESEGNAQAGYYYLLQKPINWYAGYSSKRSTCGGTVSVDSASVKASNMQISNICKIEFSGVQDKSKLSFGYNSNSKEEDTKRAVNGTITIGNDNKFWSYEGISSDTKFTSELKVKSVIPVTYMTWLRESKCCSCCNPPPGVKCDDHRSIVTYTCANPKTANLEYTYTDTTNFSAKLYKKPSPQNEIIVEINKDQSPDVIVNTGAVDYHLEFGNAELNKVGSEYQVMHYFPPYNIIHIRRTNVKHYEISELKILSSGLGYVKFHTTAKNIAGCAMSYLFPFTKETGIECNYQERNKADIELRTEKTSYEKGDKINVFVGLRTAEENASGTVNLQYCSQSKTVNINDDYGEAEFEAERGCSEINAVYDDYGTQKNSSAFISVKSDRTLVYSLIIFFAFVALFLKIGAELHRRSRL